MRFQADTTMSIGAHVQVNSTVDIVVTAHTVPNGVEVLRVEVYDPKTKTLHMLPECLVDLLTGDADTKAWLIDWRPSPF